MRIIENPPNHQLIKLQEVLSKDTEAGIDDIWGTLVFDYIGAEDNGVLVGVASVSLNDEFAEIYKLYVAPSQRGKGIGSLILERTIQYVRERGVRALGVEIAGNSYSFWEKATSNYRIKKYSDTKFEIIISA
ncbi:GNAT family N-acetyltransferase [Azotobacter vinelandii]